MLDSRDARLTALAAPLGLDVDAPLVIGGQYCAVLQYGELLYVSGQVPRVLGSPVAARCLAQGQSAPGCHGYSLPVSE